MPAQKKTVKKRAVRKKVATKTVKKKVSRKKSAPVKKQENKILPKHQELINSLSQYPAPTIKEAAAEIGMAYNWARKLCQRLHIIDAIEAQRVQITKNAIEKASVSKADVLLGSKELFERCMQHKPVFDKEGNPVLVETRSGEVAPVYEFDSGGAARALKLMGDHIDVNAFKSLDDDGNPIDQNWRVTIVDAKTGEAKVLDSSS